MSYLHYMDGCDILRKTILPTPDEGWATKYVTYSNNVPDLHLLIENLTDLFLGCDWREFAHLR